MVALTIARGRHDRQLGALAGRLVFRGGRRGGNNAKGRDGRKNGKTLHLD